MSPSNSITYPGWRLTFGIYICKFWIQWIAIIFFILVYTVFFFSLFLVFELWNLIQFNALNFNIKFLFYLFSNPCSFSMIVHFICLFVWYFNWHFIWTTQMFLFMQFECCFLLFYNFIYSVFLFMFFGLFLFRTQSNRND